MHERPHQHHLYVFLSHKQPQAFGNISRLGCECRELAINPVPGKIGGKIGSWRHTGEVLLAFDSDCHYTVCGTEQRQSILHGTGCSCASVPRNCDASWLRRSALPRNKKQSVATIEKNIFNHRALRRIGNVDRIEDCEIVYPRQLHEAFRSGFKW